MAIRAAASDHVYPDIEAGVPPPGDLLPAPVPASKLIMTRWGVTAAVGTIKNYPDAVGMIRSLVAIKSSGSSSWTYIGPALQLVSVIEVVNHALAFKQSLQLLGQVHRQGDALTEIEMGFRALVWLTGMTANILVLTCVIRQLGWGNNDLNNTLDPWVRDLSTAFLAGTVAERGANQMRVSRLRRQLGALMALPRNPQRDLQELHESATWQLELSIALGSSYEPIRDRLAILYERGDRLSEHEAAALLQEVGATLKAAKGQDLVRMVALTIILVGQWLPGVEAYWGQSTGLLLLTVSNVWENYRLAHTGYVTREVGRHGLLERISLAHTQEARRELISAIYPPESEPTAPNDLKRLLGLVRREIVMLHQARGDAEHLQFIHDQLVAKLVVPLRGQGVER
jgi:hypothetical protein